MSYDVTFYQERAIGEPWKNYTSNVSPMWYQALGGVTLGDIIELHPRAGNLLPFLLRAIRAMRADPAAYKAMNPENGWGDYYGAVRFLVWMARNCKRDPDAKVEVWR